MSYKFHIIKLYTNNMTVLRPCLHNQVMNTGIGVEIHYTQAFIMLAVDYSNNIHKKYFSHQTNHLQYNSAALSKSSGLSHFC